MRNLFLSLILLLVSCASFTAQVVTTNPAIVTQDCGEVEVIFDATKGSGGLKDFTGDVYAHTGVITTASANGSDWKHAPTWGDNSAKYKLTSLGGNKWKLLITPSISAYYNLAANEKVTKLAFVFRSADKTKEGKDTGGADIFVDVHEEGLAVSFVTPASNTSIAAGTSLAIDVASTAPADLSLYINKAIAKTASSAERLTHDYLFQAGDYMLVAEAKVGSQQVFDTVYVCAPEPVTTASRPEGVTDGINYIDNSTVTFVLFAPQKSNVFLIGDFNNWTQLNAYQMKKDGDYWWFTLSGVNPGELYGFQYLVDGSLRVSDAYTELVLDPWNDRYINENQTVFPDLKPYPDGKTDGIVSTFQTNKPAYQWLISDLTMPDRENMVIYELLIRDFSAEKTLQAVLDRLDYIKNLGVTAIELMPIQEFDGNSSWGYNPNHYFAPDKAYGTPEMYKIFIDACHQQGIAVILDVVFNHATENNPFAKLYWNSADGKPAADNPWFNVDAPHPYSVFCDFNHEYAGTRAFFKRVLAYWITEYKVDGFRLDLTKGFTQKTSNESTASNYDQSRIDILTDYYRAAKAVKPDVMFILEHFCANSEELVLANEGMYLWRNLNNAYSQAAMGFSSESDFSGMNATPRQWVGYAESHDEERNFYKAKTWGDGNIKNPAVYLKRVPLNIAFATLIPGPKMIWQFGELGYDYSIDYNGGRTNEKPSPFAIGWMDITERKAAYNAVSKILNLRKSYPAAFDAGAFSFNISTSDWNYGRKIKLTHSDLDMIALGNFQSTNTISVSVDFQHTGVWYELLTGEELNVSAASAYISLQPGELRVYTDRKVDFSDIPAISRNNGVYAYISGGYANVVSQDNVKTLSIYNLTGMKLKAVSDSNALYVGDLPSGVYLIEAQTINEKNVIKILLKK
ncbi:MAG: T9SS type A sorting domain-containing protein [Dysgonamonadaceae bacterium]|jgi:1,4-alpha-glucan branching enzyme|nr:T9SS type A sorting domain-containing protein [Dysgonamonadaceae bacterium]